jgi:hypothetical protein
MVYRVLLFRPPPRNFLQRPVAPELLIMDLGIRVSGMEFRVLGPGFRVSGLGFRVSGLGFRVSGLGFEVWSL